MAEVGGAVGGGASWEGVQCHLRMGHPHAPSPCSSVKSLGVCVRAIALVAAGLVAGACAAVIDPSAIADAQTVARAKTVLVNDPRVGTAAIEVRVRHGVAILSGRVVSEEDAAHARRLVASVPGVTGVQVDIQIAEEPPPPLDRPLVDMQTEFNELGLGEDTGPRWLAVGASLGWSQPQDAALGDRRSIGPLFKIGAGSGLGLAIGLDWFQASLQSQGADARSLTRVRVRPVMAGIGYTMVADRLAVTPSLVGGVAFNSLSVTETGLAAGLPVEVSNSLVWRPAVSVWYDVSRRIALNVTVGRIVTRMRVTVLDGERLDRRNLRGDTTTVHAGLAYRLF